MPSHEARQSRKHFNKCWHRHPSGCSGCFPYRQSLNLPANAARQLDVAAQHQFTHDTGSLLVPRFTNAANTFQGKAARHKVLVMMMYLKKICIPFRWRQRRCNNNDQNYRGLGSKGRKEGISALSGRQKNLKLLIGMPHCLYGGKKSPW